MVDDRQSGDTESMEYGWSIIADAQVCLEKGSSSLSSDSRKGIVCVSTAKPRDIVFEGIEYSIGAEDAIVVIVGDGEYHPEADDRMVVIVKVPGDVNKDELQRLETWARLSVGDRFHLIVSGEVERPEHHRSVVVPVPPSDNSVDEKKGSSAKSKEEASDHATSSEEEEEEWPSSDEIASRILENSDWAAQCIQSGALDEIA
ncbi:Gamma-tubulin complex component 2 [Perkinsus chesapeaki]|uniref:Gamma-tubulin complex component 2 n=1 Tax=Perkinsus chesapeaki TaxID=330153 RepID=A0A7J6LHM1_PERCH|nr:Gamma-tubulin complex component 2 [Perkinsus chesapeaki]